MRRTFSERRVVERFQLLVERTRGRSISGSVGNSNSDSANKNGRNDAADSDPTWWVHADIKWDDKHFLVVCCWRPTRPVKGTYRAKRWL